MKLKKLVLPVVAACLLLSACGKKAEEPAEPEKEVVEEVAEAEETVCEHVFTEATYHAPKTCTICGVTEGDVKPAYFEELGVRVDPVPMDYETKVFVEVNEDPEELSYTTPGLFHVESITEEPQGDGSVIVTMVSTISYDVCYEDEWWDQSVMTNWIDGLYDYYTGKHFGHDDLIDDSHMEYSVEVSYDGEDYTVEYTMQNEWDYSDYWYDDHSSNQTFFCTKTTTIYVPEGYDGIVYAIYDTCGFDEDDTDLTEYFEPDFSVNTRVDGVHLFRVNPAGVEPSENSDSEGDHAGYVVSAPIITGGDVQAYIDALEKEGKPDINFEGKDDKLKKLGFEVNEYDNGSYSLLKMGENDGYCITPSVGVVEYMDFKNGVVYQYQWFDGVLSVSQGMDYHYFVYGAGHYNTCTAEDFEGLTVFMDDIQKLYDQVK